jgi:hypothetical protein
MVHVSAIRRKVLVTRTLLALVSAMTLTGVQHARAEESPDVLRAIPVATAGAKRLITLDDLLRLRDIDSLSLSPDGSHLRFSASPRIKHICAR